MSATSRSKKPAPSIKGDAPALKRLRAICATFPETTEVEAWKHPTFRVRGKTFVAYEIVKGRTSIAFRVSRDDAEILLRADPRFFATPYGRGLWVSIWADGSISWPLVRDLALKSFRLVAP